MQFRLASGFLIFVGSYLPLAIILAVQDIPMAWWSNPLCTPQAFRAGQCALIPFANPELALSFLALSIVAVLATHLMFQKLSYPFDVRVECAKTIPNDLINYTFPYVVSFMGISYAEPEKLLGFGVFLLWMFAITYRSGQIIMNPLLLILGWKLHEAEILIGNARREVRVLKRGALIPGAQVGQTIQDFYIVKD